MKRDIKLASVSDIHLGHDRNVTPFIITNLRQALPDDATTASLDFIFLVGDVFDGLLSRADESCVAIDMWIMDLLWLCKKHGIRLRVLEGTRSHDWKQSACFVTLNEGAKIGCDLQYIDKLSIVYEPEFDINILYIPDEWEPDPNDTYAQVQELMRAKGLEKVDFAFMHGQFEYQLPPVVKAPKHNSEAYLSIVKHLIFIGHVHIHSILDRIYAQGSFDRLAHGEEHPKGYVRATVFKNGDFTAEFVENKNARKFITIETVGLTLDETLAEIEAKIQGLPNDSFVRVSCLAGNPLLENMHELVLRWPLYTWSKIKREIKEEAPEVLDNELSQLDFIPITITRDNITKLVTDRVRQKGVSLDILEMVERTVTELR